MGRGPLNTYLWAAFLIALLSVLASCLILLFGLSDFGPFDPPDTNTIEHVAQVSTLSAAVSGIFALMVGAIAIIAVIVAERAETRAVEQLKVDISRLWMILHSLRNRGILYTSPSSVRTDLDIFAQERVVIDEIINSTTGFSIYVWQANHEDRDLADLTADIAGLQNLLTLKIEENPSALFNQIAIRANKLAKKMSNLTDRDLGEMASVSQKIGIGLDEARRISSSDTIAEFIAEFERARNEVFERPAEEDVERIAQRAQERIGGQAGQSVRHFGDLALHGNAADVAQWHNLIRQLGIAD